MPPDEPTEEEKLEKLPEDGQTPCRPSDEARDRFTKALDDTHPATDTNNLAEEAYDEGVSGAAEANEPNVGDAVTNYNKPTPDNEHPKGDNHDYPEAA